MIDIAMTPEQFDKARAAIRTASEIRDYSEDSPSVGTLRTDQIAMTYAYDGTTLHVVVGERHGMAKLASESTIKARLEALLSRV